MINDHELDATCISEISVLCLGGSFNYHTSIINEKAARLLFVQAPLVSYGFIGQLARNRLVYKYRTLADP